MQGFNNFIKKSVIGGLLVISPAVIIFFAFRWAFYTVSDLIQPLTTPLTHWVSAPDPIIDLLVILLILLGCFIVGNLVTTGTGKWLHDRFDNTLAKLAPGYRLVKDIINQFFGDTSNSPFSKGPVVKARLYGAEVPTEVLGIVTSKHSNGWYTIFVPTGPNPTTGFIYQLSPELVVILPDIKVEEALKTIIACGSGSRELLDKQATQQT